MIEQGVSLILENLPQALQSHAQLRDVDEHRFTDSDLYKIVLGATLGINPFHKIHPGSLAQDYGFITDYFCEIMHELRRKDVLGSLKPRYQLMDTSTAQAGITGRDVRGIEKILSGLLNPR